MGFQEENTPTKNSTLPNEAIVNLDNLILARIGVWTIDDANTASSWARY
jgi:hypothetical protein